MNLKLIKLTVASNRPIYVNLEEIAAIKEYLTACMQTTDAQMESSPMAGAMSKRAA